MRFIASYELEPTRQKSFYGKAKIIICENLDGKVVKYLKSYDTIVCAIKEDGTFERKWDGYSATTMKHINDFITTEGIKDMFNVGGKKWWISQKVYGLINLEKNILNYV